ncbi:MAG TPA: AAA family ATPase, partial [Acidimicrobiia bacterium]|nr:AAA family ATPase [Acidimicrobiia bacterium]
MSSLMTVVFVDVEGSTELLTRLGDRAGLDAIDRVLSEVRERIEAYEGREVKSLGDGSMLVFPSPRQAITFAVAVQRALVGRRPLLRVGINTGEVTGSGADPVGEAVSAAARIGDRAEGGEVLVSEVVRQLVGTMPGLRFSDRGRHRLRGFAERWRLYRVTGADGSSDPMPVFGRDPELDAVDWLLDGAAGGVGRVLVLEGEAGIGKTALVRAARSRSTQRGLAVFAGNADDLERDQPGRLLFMIGTELGIDLDRLARGLPEGGAAAIEALIEAIGGHATRQPVVVVAEDLHWADELSLRGLVALVRHTKSLPVGFLATMRPTPRPPLLNQLLDRLDRDASREVRLRGLDAAALAALVSSQYGAPPGRKLTQWLESTAGNPLFVVELARSLDDDGVLHVANGFVDTDIERLPEELRETIVRRLSMLSADCNELLRLASLLGSDFTLIELAAIAGRSVVSVAAQLHEAVDAGILEGAGDTLSFRHDLIREAVYHTMAPAIRRDLHAASARALVATGARPTAIARHFSLGARIGDADAATWLSRAASEAVTLEPAVAVALLEQALEIAPDDWAERDATEIALLEPLAHAGHVDDARVRAVALLERTANPATQFEIRRALAAVLASAGDLANSSVQCAQAVGIADAPAAEARTLSCLGAGQQVLLGSDPNDAIAAVEHALSVGDDGDALLTCVAHQTLAMAAGAQARFNDAIDHVRVARRSFDVRAMPRMGFLIPDIWEATFAFSADEIDDALRISDRVGRDSEKRGEMILLVQTNVCSGGVNFIAGRWDDAVRDLESGLVVADETGAHAQLVFSHGLLTIIALGRGDRVGAERRLAAGRAALADGLHLFGIDILLWANAQMLEATDDPEGALGVLSSLWEQTVSLRGLLQYRNIAPELVRLATQCGQDSLAQAVTNETLALAERSNIASARAAALRCQGLADRDGDRLLAANELLRSTPRRIELAACCEEAAGLLAKNGRVDEATVLLDEAAEIHQQSGATAHLARVDAMLRAHGRRRRRNRRKPVEFGWDALSPKEHDVAELVAQGLSNPQIGERLYISRRTVETHLAHTFRKLG